MEEKDTRAATPHPRTMVCNDPNCGVHALHDKPPPSDPSFGRVCGCGAIWLTQGFHALRDMGGTMHRRGAPCYVDPAPPAAVASEQPPARPPDSVSESLREARRLLGEARLTVAGGIGTHGEECRAQRAGEGDCEALTNMRATLKALDAFLGQPAAGPSSPLDPGEQK